MAATSSDWWVTRSELTTNPSGRSGAWLTEQHAGRSSLKAGTRASSLGQHVVTPIACICCIDIEHCITWSPVTSASPASAHNAIVNANIAVTIFRDVVLVSIVEGLLSGAIEWTVCDACHLCLLFRRTTSRMVPMSWPNLSS
jgi:hypothetical protein